MGEPADSGVADGDLLISFTEAAVRAEPLDELRGELIARVGPHAAAHAAATIAAFSGLVRVADGTGIPIDDGLAAVSVEIRDQLSLEKYSGAVNSEGVSVEAQPFTTVDALF